MRATCAVVAARPRRSDQMDHLYLAREVYDEIARTVGSMRAEQGGALGWRETNGSSATSSSTRPRRAPAPPTHLTT